MVTDGNWTYRAVYTSTELFSCTPATNILSCTNCTSIEKTHTRDFPGGPVVKNPPSNAGDVDSIPGRGTKIPHAAGQLSPRALEPARHNY